MFALPISMLHFKSIILSNYSSAIKLFLPKKCKIFERWELRPQTPKTAAPLRISGYAPGLQNIRIFEVLSLKFLSSPPTKFSGSATAQGGRSLLSIGGDNLLFYPNFAVFSRLGV